MKHGHHPYTSHKKLQQYRNRHKRLVQSWLSDFNNPLSLGHLQGKLDACLIADLNNPLSLGHLQTSLHDARLIADLNNPLSLGHLQASLHDARLITDLSIFFTVYFMVL